MFGCFWQLGVLVLVLIWLAIKFWPVTLVLIIIGSLIYLIRYNRDHPGPFDSGQYRPKL